MEEKLKLENYIRYMLKRKDFVLFCLRDYKGKLVVAKEEENKVHIKYWTDKIQREEAELKMVNDIIDYFQLEHFKYV